MKKDLNPHPIKNVLTGDEAWLYRNSKSIDVCIYQKGKGTLVARITDSQLKKLLTKD